jgi:hypothetical protein
VIPQSTIRKLYKDFLSNWDWDLHITLTFRRVFPYDVALGEARRYLWRVKRRCRKARFGGIILLADPHRFGPHLHILLVSDPSYPKTLLDFPADWLELLWTRRIRITTRRQWSNETISGYPVSHKNIRHFDSDNYRMEFYRLGLLSRLRRNGV